MTEIRPANWTAVGVRCLQMQCEAADRLRLAHVYVAGVPMSLDHARHILSCLQDPQLPLFPSRSDNLSVRPLN